MGAAGGNLVKLHNQLMMMKSTKDRLIFGGPRPALGSLVGGPSTSLPPKDAGAAKPGNKVPVKRPARPAVAPSGFKFWSPDEYKKLMSGKCNQCGSADHLFRQCPIERFKIRCSNHPHCNFHFQHSTPCCPLLKLAASVAATAVVEEVKDE